MTRKAKSEPRIETGSGNIFADLGLPDAHFLKAQIVSEIYRLTNARKLNQTQAGKRMGITQPEVSRLFKGNFREYSVDRLMGFLTVFDRDVEITVRPHKKAGKAGKITFTPVAAGSSSADRRARRLANNALLARAACSPYAESRGDLAALRLYQRMSERRRAVSSSVGRRTRSCV